MDKRIRSRIWVIGALIAVSIISLVPRNTKQRVIDPSTGRLRDTTVRRLPIPCLRVGTGRRPPRRYRPEDVQRWIEERIA